MSCTNFIGCEKYFRYAPFKNADQRWCSTVLLNKDNYSKNVCPLKKLIKTRGCTKGVG